MSIDLKNNAQNNIDQIRIQTPIDNISNKISKKKRAETSKRHNRLTIQQLKKLPNKLNEFPNQKNSWIIQGKYIDFGDSNQKSIIYFQ